MSDYEKIRGMVQSDDADERNEAIFQIIYNFKNFTDTDKEQSWKELLKLTKDENSIVRWCAAGALGPAFHYVTNKEQATKDLLNLTKDNDSDVRIGAADALGSAFQYVTNKEQAWKAMLKLTKDENSDVRWCAANALGPAFQYVTDKEQATKDLLNLTKDKDSSMREGAPNALGHAFQYITDKEQATKDLLNLTKDKDSDVRVSANYSLGKISIYRATEAETEDGLKEEISRAIKYFEKSSEESTYFNPAKFCLPFYRSYNAVIFRKEGAKEEIEKNIDEAKQAVAGSESKEKLLEAVQNLANALEEAQKLRVLDEIQADLSTYMTYCNRAAELLKSTERNAPIATELIKKGMPIIDKTINEIQQKARAICEETKNAGTPFESLGFETNRLAKELTSKDLSKTENSITRIAYTLNEFCNFLPEGKKGHGCDLVKSIDAEKYLEEQLNIIDIALTYIHPNIKPEQPLRIRKILEILGLSFTIAGVIWGIIYAILSEMSYATSMRESLIIFSFTFILILLISVKKR